MAHRAVATAGYVAISAVDSVLAGRPDRTARRWRHVTKPALMPLLHAAVDASRCRASTRRGLAVAHAASWGGDVALLGRGNRAFLTGLGSFLAAHVAYVGTLASRRRRDGWAWNGTTRTAAVLWVGITPAMAVAAGRKDSSLTGPVALYGTALTALLAAAGQLEAEHAPGAAREVLVGTGLFLASDLLLGVRTFLLHDHQPALERAVMATYTAAQALIAHGVTRL